MHEGQPHDGPHQRRKPAIGRAGLMTAALACGALVLAACGGGSSVPPVAGSGSSPKTASSSSKGSGANPWPTRPACARTACPISLTPTVGGFAMPSDIDPNSPRYQAAANACKAYAGHGLN